MVLYHAECADGFGAAWALWKRFPHAQFIPVKHGIPPPVGLDQRRVLIADFSYAREVLEGLASQTAGLVVLDHHVTAEEALAGLPYVFFNLHKSGAVLAWEWAHDEPVPWLLRYVQDKDLWHWNLPASREINAALASHPFAFTVWDELRQDVLEADGRAILRYENELAEKIASKAVMVSFHGEMVPAVQSAILTSQIGERLSAHHPFCLMWHDRDGRRYISLRSREDQLDVGQIALAHGGGGHTHAAGFSFPLNNPDSSPLAPLLKAEGTQQNEGTGNK